MKTIVFALVLSLALVATASAEVLTKHIAAPSLVKRRPLIGETTAPVLSTWGTETVYTFGNGDHWTAVGFVLDIDYAHSLPIGCVLNSIQVQYTNYGNYDAMNFETWLVRTNGPAVLLGHMYYTGAPYSGYVDTWYSASNHVMAPGDQVTTYANGIGGSHIVHGMGYKATCP